MNRTHLLLTVNTMMQSGAPLDKFRVMYLMFTYIPWFHKQINSKGYHSLVTGLISSLLETVWVPLSYKPGFRIKAWQCKEAGAFNPELSVASSFSLIVNIPNSYFT